MEKCAAHGLCNDNDGDQSSINIDTFRLEHKNIVLIA